MSIEHKYWYRLLKHFDRKGYFYNGLTLPFIIGSRLYLEPEKKVQTIEELITDFKTSNTYINVLECDGIGEYVFRIADPGDENIYRTLENFVITDSSFLGYNNIKEVVMELDRQYHPFIQGQKFSKSDGKWDIFNPELDIIRFKEVK